MTKKTPNYQEELFKVPAVFLDKCGVCEKKPEKIYYRRVEEVGSDGRVFNTVYRCEWCVKEEV